MRTNPLARVDFYETLDEFLERGGTLFGNQETRHMATRRKAAKKTRRPSLATQRMHEIVELNQQLKGVQQQALAANDQTRRLTTELNVVKNAPTWLVRDYTTGGPNAPTVLRPTPLTALSNSQVLNALHQVENSVAQTTIPVFARGTADVKTTPVHPNSHPSYAALVAECEQRGLIGLQRSGSDSASRIEQAE